jgi:RNA polymerase sigma-70 factor (ECF subfamily)
MDSARLVARIQAGDREGFAELYLRYFDRVYSYLRTALNDPHGAEDATQSVFINVMEALPRYERRRQPFRAWLFVIVRNFALNELQKRSRADVLDPAQLDRLRDRSAPTEDELSALEWITDRDLMLFIERLPLAQRQVLLLRFMLDLSSGEIAAVLGLTASQVRAHQHRALRLLENRLVALGREPVRDGGKILMRRWGTQALVLRRRRFVLGGR